MFTENRFMNSLTFRWHGSRSLSGTRSAARNRWHGQGFTCPWVILLLVLLFFMTACTVNFTRDTYRGLAVSFNAYDVVMQGMADLYQQKLIGEDVRTQVVKYGRAYKLAHNGVVEALAVYEEKGGQQNKDAVTAAATKASEALAQLIAYAKPFLLKAGKEVPK